MLIKPLNQEKNWKFFAFAALGEALDKMRLADVRTVQRFLDGEFDSKKCDTTIESGAASPPSLMERNPHAEPVAWAWVEHDGLGGSPVTHYGPNPPHWGRQAIPLYAATTQRAPIKKFTRAQVRRLWENSPEIHKDASSFEAFIRIVDLAEAAHGIGGRAVRGEK